MEAAVCTRCCAPLPVPVGGGSTCRYCGTFHTLRAPVDDVDEDDDFDVEDFGDGYDVVPMTDDGVLACLREHLMGVDSVYLAPSIPGKKEQNVRRIHAAHLPPNERILLLYDDTVFGSADDGFVITSRRVCWKNMMQAPAMLEWAHIDPDEVYAEERCLRIRGAKIESATASDSGLLDTCQEVFSVLAASARAAGRPAVAGLAAGLHGLLGAAVGMAAAGPPAHGGGAFGGPGAANGYANAAPQPGYGQSGYGAPPQHGYGQGGYPPPPQHGYGQGSYPAPQHGQGGYPPQQPGQGGYPPQHGQGGYPPQQGQGGYPPPQHGQGGHPPPQQGYGPYGPPSSGYGYHGPPSPGPHGPPPAAPGGAGWGGHAPQPPQAQNVNVPCWHCRAPLHWQSPHCPRCGARPGPHGWPR